MNEAQYDILYELCLTFQIAHDQHTVYLIAHLDLLFRGEDCNDMISRVSQSEGDLHTNL